MICNKFNRFEQIKLLQKSMRKILIKFLALTLLVVIGSSINLFNLVTLPKSSGAMCMDGSQYGIYLFTPDELTADNKLFIYFEDIWEGWCARDTLNESIAHCEKYVSDSNFLEYGSSDNWSGSFTTLNGILSSNSIFGAWPKVLIKSCDGGSYFSDSNATFKNKILNFKGSKNVLETINYLNKNNMLLNKQEIVIVGVGNGAIGALAWANTIKANTKGKVRVLVDSGVWQNQVNQKTKTPVFQNRMKLMDKLFLNGKSFPNTNCEAANKDNIQKCFYSSELTKYVDSNIQIMFLESYYDTWEAAEILGLNCSQDFGSLSECTAEHRQAIQDYHKKIENSLNELTKLPNVGAFGIACVAHFFTNGKWDNTDFSVPMGSNNTAQVVVQKWLNSNSSTEPFKYLDSVAWPDNKPCSRQLKTINLSSE